MGKLRSLIAFVVALAAVAAAGQAASAQDGARPAAERPNLIVIVTDDQDEALFSRHLMPNTFALFDDGGTRLTDFTITTPLCCPSRATQLTGQYGHNNGVLANDPGYPALRDPANVLPEWLRGAGYRTAQVGRYLNGYKRGGSPATPAPGWDRWVGLMDLHYRDYDLSVDGRRRTVRGMDASSYVTRNLGSRSSGLVRDLADDDAPFYLQIDHLAPHSDHLARGICTRSALPGPQKLRPVRDLRLPRNPAREADVGDKPSFIRELPRIDREAFAGVLHRMRCRAASIREADRSIGRLRRTLERTGELDDTAIVFYSDNGYFTGEHNLTKGKGLPYEEAVSVPALIRVPPAFLGGVVAPPELEVTTANMDVAPTVLDLAGAEPCNQEGTCRLPDGRSLLPVLEDPSDWPRPRPLLIEIDQQGRIAGSTLGCSWSAIKSGDQVYVEYKRVLMKDVDRCVETDDREHYRLRPDPRERHNLWPPQTDRDANSQAELAVELETLRTCAGAAGSPDASANPCP